MFPKHRDLWQRWHPGHAADQHAQSARGELPHLRRGPRVRLHLWRSGGQRSLLWPRVPGPPHLHSWWRQGSCQVQLLRISLPFHIVKVGLQFWQKESSYWVFLKQPAKIKFRYRVSQKNLSYLIKSYQILSNLIKSYQIFQNFSNLIKSWNLIKLGTILVWNLIKYQVLESYQIALVIASIDQFDLVYSTAKIK